MTERLPRIEWQHLLAALILVILLVPIRRYALPGQLPFQLELYRLFAGLLILVWVGSLLVDRRVLLRRTGFEGPFALILGSALASIVLNPARVSQTSAEVNKSLMFLLSFVVVLYVTVSCVRTVADVEFLARWLVAGGTIVSLFALVEARTGYNVFNHLGTVMPFLHDLGDVGGFQRVGSDKLRVFASAQHPIALSAALVMLAPLALYLARRYGQRRWLVCALVLGVACASTVSRTGVVMFGVVALTFVWLRPRDTLRLWPALLAALVVTHFALPGTLGAIKHSFSPPGGLLAEQRGSADSSGSGRLADLGPALDLWTRQPLLGQGYGTNVVNPDAGGVEANIFDDQWLGTLLATGLLGFLGWLWFFGRAIGRFGRAAKRDLTDRGWLLVAITAAIAAYAVGMVTYDAFAFIQVTFLVFILVGLGVALLGADSAPTDAARSTRPTPRPVTRSA